MFKLGDSKVHFPTMEEEILAFWKKENIFQKSIDQRKNAKDYIFYDGPPFATGLPHFGHFVPGTIKDIIPRYQTMAGRRVHRRFGWDCHGLPVEYEIEKELGISGRSNIEEYGVARFNNACKSIVLRYTSEWEKTMTRMGRWVDFENDYKTMDLEYMESIWWVFKELWQKNLIYEGFYILPYSPKLATPLSNFEVNLGGYKNVTDPAITVKFKITQNVEEPAVPTFFLAWTTTPWTLPSNLALALGADIDYVRISTGNEQYILAESRLHAYYTSNTDYRIEQRYKGSELENWLYEPLFSYFAEQKQKGAFRTCIGDFVSTEEGTGIVHLAPGFGEDDYKTLKDTGVDIIVPIDAEARFTESVPDLAGIFVKDADKKIITMLRSAGMLLRRENYVHSYPHCYRTGAPLIYRAVSSWFVDISTIKETMIRANTEISWLPDHIKKGRFGQWLENAREWAISRNRFWGNPIPIWKCSACEHVECIGSLQELEEKAGRKVDDIHKHIVDTLEWNCHCAEGTMKRVPEVLDCWFESGAMPYAQNHYPFKNKQVFESHFPADFISEGQDQTRGWFYTLTVLAAALFEKPAFQNVIVSGLVLAEDGRKMAKKDKNYSDPVDIINSYGADALRLFLMNSSVVKCEDLKYSDSGVREVLKSVLLPLWSAYSFFATYANIDNIQTDELNKTRTHTRSKELRNPLDSWILSELQSLIQQVSGSLNAYDLQKAITPIVWFIDQLNNWYIRRSRRRFWRSENDADKMEAYSTLYEVLLGLVMVAAPFIPFISEEIYRNLRSSGMKESVHLCDFPIADASLRDIDLERKMSLVQQAVSMGRAIRNAHNLKVRQPLAAIHCVTLNREEKNILVEMEDIIRDELNVKEVILRDNETELVTYEAKANFKELGKKLGKNMKTVSQEIARLESKEIQSIIEGNVLTIAVNGQDFELSADDVIVQRNEKEGLKVLNEGNLTIALDSLISEELHQEGIVRDLVRAIQNLRKESGFDVSDRISLEIQGSNEIIEAVKSFRNYFTQEVLCTSLNFTTAEQDIALLSGRVTLSISRISE